jgi:hypothetical protein
MESLRGIPIRIPQNRHAVTAYPAQIYAVAKQVAHRLARTMSSDANQRRISVDLKSRQGGAGNVDTAFLLVNAAMGSAFC